MIFFSIVIPLYNKCDSIIKALESIKNQVYRDFEVIIINDGSTDNSFQVVQDWIDLLGKSEQTKYTIFTHSNQGVSTARNTGVQKAQYDYIAFCDADDYWEINHLLNLSLLIDKYSDKVDMFSNAIKLEQNNLFIFPNLVPYENYFGIVDFFEVTSTSHGFVHTSSICVKKSVIVKNFFPIDMKNFEDVITWARIANNKGVAFSSERTSVYVIENAEASRSVDFQNYIKFEKLLFSIPYDKHQLEKYLKRIFLFSIFAARVDMPYIEFLRGAIQVRGKSKLITIYSLVALLIPKFILSYLRHKRKK